MAFFSRRAQGLIVVALVFVLGLAVWYGRTVWEDSGSFAFALFGIPAACTILALWAERSSRTMLAPAVILALALIQLAWSLLTALGLGILFVAPAVLLLLAALVSWIDRSRRSSSASLRT